LHAFLLIAHSLVEFLALNFLSRSSGDEIPTLVALIRLKAPEQEWQNSKPHDNLDDSSFFMDKIKH
jgi:hypothetical protein